MAKEESSALLGDAAAWKVGQIVKVQPRTWAGINRLGGQGVVTCVHADATTGQVGKIDVRYVLGGFDKLVDVHYVEACADSSKVQSSKGRRTTPRAVATAAKTTTSPAGLQQLVAPSKKRQRPGTDNKENSGNNDPTKIPSKKQKCAALVKASATERSNTVQRNVVQVRRTIVGASRKRLPSQANAGKDIGNSSLPVAGKKPKQLQRRIASSRAAVPTPDVPKIILVKQPSSASSSISTLSSPLGILSRTPRSYMLPECARGKLKSDGPQDGHLDSSERNTSKSSKSAARILYPPGGTTRHDPSSVSVCGKKQAEEDRKPKASSMKDGHEPENSNCKPAAVTGSNLAEMKSAGAVASIDDGASKGTPKIPTLQSEHLRIMNSAARFIQEVVDKEHCPKASPADKTSKYKDEQPADPEAFDPTILAEFLRSLHELLEQNGGDGLDEENIFKGINKYSESQKPFTSGEVEAFLDHLCKENKVMRSDGLVYII
ncbi:hypothetical protein ACA910_006022 [Epithemia clementina (nom. ined.)]